MKVLFLTENFPPERNAAASRVYERACYWVQWGHNVTVVTCAPNYPEGKVYPGYRNRSYQVEYRDGIRVVRVKSFIAKNEGVVLRIVDQLSFMLTGWLGGVVQERPDVIVATTPQFFNALGGWAVAAIRRLPFVLEISDLWLTQITEVGAMRDSVALRALKRLELFLFKQAEQVVTLTPAYERDLVGRGVPAVKIHSILNGVDLRRFSPRPKDQALAHSLGLQDSFVVAYIGTHGMSHALEQVLDAAERLTEVKDLRFLFVGNGATRESLIAEAERRRLANVVFVPAQPKDEIRRFWSLCDVALAVLKNKPLFSTVIPSKIFEAMAMQRAVILAAPEGEAAGLVRETHSGLTVGAEDPEALAGAVLRLYRDRSLLAELARDSHLAAPRFTRERQAREVLGVLAQASGQPVLTGEALDLPQAGN